MGLELRPFCRPARSLSLYRLSYCGYLILCPTNQQITNNTASELLIQNKMTLCSFFSYMSMINKILHLLKQRINTFARRVTVDYSRKTLERSLSSSGI
jgi:hypothetical protein